MIFVVSGPGGAGKDTIATRLVERDPELRLSQSWTTRAQRPGESDDAYRFVGTEAFRDRARGGGFLEWAEYLGHLYGTPLPEGDEDTILVIDVQGAAQVLDRVPEARMILVVPPSRADQAERMEARGDDEEHVAKRLEAADREEEAGRRMAHHVVVNDDLERAVEEVAGILARYRGSGDTGPEITGPEITGPEMTGPEMTGPGET